MASTISTGQIARCLSKARGIPAWLADQLVEDRLEEVVSFMTPGNTIQEIVGRVFPPAWVESQTPRSVRR